MLLFVATLVALVLFALAEGLARLVVPAGDVHQPVDHFAALMKPCFERGAPRTPPGVQRVFVIGESSAQMLGGPLSDLARSENPPAVEVFNCAQGGASLPHVQRRFEEVLAYDPDTIVLLFGHNTYVDITMDIRAIRLAQLARRSRLISVLVHAPLDVTFKPDHFYLEQLQSFLRTFVEVSEARSIQTQISIPVGNLWYAPGYENNADYRQVLHSRMLQAVGDLDQAGALLGEEDSPAKLFERGLVLVQQGRTEEAQPLLVASRDRSGAHTFRASSQVLDMLRSTATSSSAVLVDGEALLLEELGTIPDWRWFLDSCHLAHRGFQLLAAEHFRLLAPPADSSDRRLAPSPEYSLNTMLRDYLPPDERTLLGQAFIRSNALAASHWGLSDEAMATLEHWMQSGEPERLGSGRQSWLFAALAQGLLQSGRAELAQRLWESTPSPGSAFVAVEWGLYLLAAQGSDAARSVVEPFAREFPANAFLELLDEAGSEGATAD